MTGKQRRFVHRIRALRKFCLSFFKRDWVLDDYPISIDYHDAATATATGRWRQDPVVASIINWGVFGGGTTLGEAMTVLEASFSKAKAERERSGDTIPRPGTRPPVRFASQERLKKHPELEKDFTTRVLKLPWAFISDESSLWDFHEEETNDEYFRRIREAYDVDVSERT